jgi:flotillin
VAEADKNFKVQKASYDAEVNQRNAEAELAYTLQQNITNQKVRAEALNIEIVEKEKRVALQEKEIERRERELEATVRKPAEAKQYEIETLARAKRTQLETEAEGEAAAKRSVGVGEADANRARGLADADVAKALGMAEADVIKAQGISEAEAKRLKAEAWKQYGQAAIIEQLVTNLPALAAAAAEPLAKTERIVVIGGGDGTSSGASKVVGDVTNIVAQMPAVLEALTGVDLISVLNSLPALQGQAAAGALADGADGAGAGAGEDGTDATDDSSDSDA